MNSTKTIREIVLVTARNADTFTVERAQEGTTALEWPAETAIKLLVTAGTLESFPQNVVIGVGIPTKEIDLGDSGDDVILDLDDLPADAAMVRIAITAGAPTVITDITGATVGVAVILAMAEGSPFSASLAYDTAPFLLSDISGEVGWPGYPLSTITLVYSPFNATYKWVEQSRTWRSS